MSPRASVKADAWTRALFALVLVWTLAGAAVFAARSMRPTAADVIGFLRQQDVARLAADDRDIVMRDAANRLNRLTFEQMREVRNNRALFLFYRPLSPAEKERFARMVLPTGLRRILDAGRAIAPGQRAAFLKEALYYAELDLAIAEPTIDPAILRGIERDALKNYLGDLRAEQRLELEPYLQPLREHLDPRE